MIAVAVELNVLVDLTNLWLLATPAKHQHIHAFITPCTVCAEGLCKQSHLNPSQRYFHDS